MREIIITIISGLSGSGKSTALNTLEDLGFFCVDNLPVLLLPKFIELCQSSINDISKIGLVMDVREREFLREYPDILDLLKTEGYRIVLIFLDSSDDVLIQRFSETRRQHPLGEGGSILDGIRMEREQLSALKSRADQIIDTSALTVHELRTLLENYFQQLSSRTMNITFMSFGFKNGVPHDVDMILDVRFLPNPHFVRELKDLDGTDPRVAEYVSRSPETQRLVRTGWENGRPNKNARPSQGSGVVERSSSRRGLNNTPAVANHAAARLSSRGIHTVSITLSPFEL